MALFSVIPANSDDTRIAKALEQSTQIDYKGDHLKIDGRIDLPEIEIPRTQEKFKNAESIKSPGINVFNGHLCAHALIRSTNQVDYSGEKWTAELKVDRIRVKNQFNVKPVPVIDFNKGTMATAPGLTEATVCSLSQLPKVNSASFVLKEPSGKVLVRFNWAAPWPPLHLNKAD